MGAFADSKKNKSSRFGSPSSGVGPTPDPRKKQLEELEALPDAPGPISTGFSTLIDLMSRTGWATSGAFEELVFKGTGPFGAGLRASRELLSGGGGWKGDKRDFIEVLEKGGVPELGRFPGPAMGPHTRYREKGAPLGGTGRGLLGMTANMVVDPLNLVGLGVGKTGLKIAGQELTKKGVKAVLAETAKAGATASPKVIAVQAAKGSIRPEVKELFRRAPYLEKQMKSLSGTVSTQQAKALIADTSSPLYSAYKEASRMLGEKAVQAAAAADPKLFRQPSRVAQVIRSQVSPWVARAAVRVPGGERALAVAETVGKAGDAAMNALTPDRVVSRFAGYVGMKQAAKNGAAKQVIDFERAYEVSPLKAWRTKAKPEDLKTFAESYEAGGVQAVGAALGPEARDAAIWFGRKKAEILADELASGIQYTPVPNYFTHFYENSPSEFVKVLHKFHPGRDINLMARLGRHVEERGFQTLREAVDWTTAQHAVDPKVPILRPIYDPVEVLRRRHSVSAETLHHRKLLRDVGEAFPDALDPARLQESYHLATRQMSQASETRLAAISAKGQAKLPALRKLTPEERGEWLNRRILAVKSRDELAAVQSKYRDLARDFPRPVVGAEDYASVNLEVLGQRYLPKDIADDLTFRIKDTRAWFDPANPDHKILKGVVDAKDWLDNTFRQSVTMGLLFPAFPFRNAYSNVAQTYYKLGLRSLDHYVARDIAAVRNAAKGTFSTPTRKWTYPELREALESAGIIRRVDVADTGARIGPSRSLFDVIPGGKKAADVSRRINQHIENDSYINLALGVLKQGGTVQDARAAVDKFLFDYGNLTLAEREVFRRAIPFWTWQSRNIRLQAQMLRDNPGRVANLIKPFRGRESDRDRMASWDAAGLRVTLARDGKTIRALTGVDLPIRQVDMLWKGSLGRTALSAAAMTTPVLRVPAELLFGQAITPGGVKSLDRMNTPAMGRLMEHAPEAIQRWAHFKKTVDDAGRPKYTMDGRKVYVLMQATFMSRMMSTSDRAFREYIDKDKPFALALLDWSTGFRLRDMDMEEEDERKFMERLRQLREWAVREGERKEFKSVYKEKQ